MSLRLILACTGVLALGACGAPDPERPETPPVQGQAASPVTADQIEQATPRTASMSAAPETGSDGPSPSQTADPGLVRVQILLDRSPFSPGIIDGFWGDNTRQAIAAYRKANNLGEGDAADEALLRHLAAADTGRVMTQYTLTEADVAGPFAPASTDLETLARSGAGYTSALERLAERFHISEGLLGALNPGVDLRAGQTLTVPLLGSPAVGEVARIVVDKTERSARAFDASGKLLAFYPATIGSSERPAPTGTLRVEGVAPEPDYTYDPARLSYDRGDRKIVVPAGPNNPVGSVWIELSRDSYGIHGTPDPSKIAKTASNGCIRMTNWDAEQLAAGVKPGVVVEFI